MSSNKKSPKTLNHPENYKAKTEKALPEKRK